MNKKLFIVLIMLLLTAVCFFIYKNEDGIYTLEKPEEIEIIRLHKQNEKGEDEVKDYEVVKDYNGNKLIKMDGNWVSYDKIMSQSISADDLYAAQRAVKELGVKGDKNYMPMEDWQIFEAAHYANENNIPGGVESFIKSGEYGNSRFCC
jgi:hypothetical protein